MLIKLAHVILSTLLSFSPVATKADTESIDMATQQVGPYQLGWWLKASGSVQVVADANHIWAEGFDQWGNYQGRLFDYWLDWYCTVRSVTSGDNLGTPLRIQLASPSGGIEACLSVGWSQYYGWTNGFGYYSGQNFYNGWYVAELESYVFPRDANLFSSRGTTIEVY